MSFSQLKPGEQVKNVSFTEDRLCVDLLDGCTMSVPLAWYPRLLHATIEQRRNWQVCGGGFGIHCWFFAKDDLIDVFLTVESPLRQGRFLTLNTNGKAAQVVELKFNRNAK